MKIPNIKEELFDILMDFLRISGKNCEVNYIFSTSRE